jgi:hypothetical protein
MLFASGCFLVRARARNSRAHARLLNESGTQGSSEALPPKREAPTEQQSTDVNGDRLESGRNR